MKTKDDESYFNGTGFYQKEYAELAEKLVPPEGSAQTLNGELLRAIGNLNQEFFRNGNENAGVISCKKGERFFVDEKEQYGYPGLNPHCEKMLDLIQEQVPSTIKVVNQLRRIIVQKPILFNSENTSLYNFLTDTVIEYVLCHTDKPLPPDYIAG